MRFVPSADNYILSRVRKESQQKLKLFTTENVLEDVDIFSYRVNDQVEPHEVLELLVFVAHHGAVVARVVERKVLLYHTVLELAAVDKSRHLRHLGNYVQDVFVRVLPILLEKGRESTEHMPEHLESWGKNCNDFDLIAIIT